MNTTRKAVNETAKIPTTRFGVLLTDQEIQSEINNYRWQIKSIQFEVRVLTRELRNRAKCAGRPLADVLSDNQEPR